MKKRILLIILSLSLVGCFEEKDRNTLLSVENEVKELRKLVECYESDNENCSTDDKKVVRSKASGDGRYTKFPTYNSHMSDEQRMMQKIHKDGEEIVRRLVSAEIKNAKEIRIGRPTISGNQVSYSALFYSEDGSSRMDVEIDFGTDIPTIRKQVLFFDDGAYRIIEQPKYKLVLIEE